MQTIYEVSILLVDDNPDLLALVSDSLRTAGYTRIRAAATCADAEVRIYDYLFNDPDPDGQGKNFLEALNPESLTVLQGCKVEACLAQIPMPEKGKNSESFQFMRQGYFCLDNRDAAPGHLVFNRAVALKESFKK